MTSSSPCERCGEVKLLVSYDGYGEVCGKCVGELLREQFGPKDKTLIEDPRPQDGGAVTTSPQKKTGVTICPHCGEQFFPDSL